MKYPASKHYPDLSIDEPIPEIELRYNEPMRAGYEAFARHAWWAIAAIFGSQLVIYMLFRDAIAGVFLSLAIGLGIVLTMVGVVNKSQREAGKQNIDDPWGVPLREQTRYWLFYAIVMLSFISGFQVFSDGIIKGVVSSASYILMFGIGLAICGRFGRQPGQISCMKCDYPLVGLQLPCPCPECGTKISCLSDATDRPRARDTRLVIIGIAIAILSCTTFVLQFYRPQALYTAMPRAALIQLAPIDRSAFDSLMLTTMTPEEEDQLIAGMYKNRTGFYSGSSYEQSEWFGAMIEQGRLTPAQLDDLYAEFTTLEIDAPKRAKVGDPIRLTLRASHAYTPTRFFYCFHGFRVGEDEPLLAQGDQVYSRTFIVNGPKQDNIDRGYVPITTWTPDTPGSYTIRARVVFAKGAGYSISSPVTWSDEGMPEYPTPPAWTRVVELEHTIEVVDE